MWTDKIHFFFNSPITWGIIALILAAVTFSGRLSVNFSNVLLILAFLLGCFGISRIEQGMHLSIIMCLFLGIILTSISWWIKPNLQTRQSAEKAAIQQQQQVSAGLFSQNFPGISLQALIKLNDVSANRRKYIFDFGRVNGSRLSIYISPDNIFTFLFIDAKDEPYNIKLPIGSSGIPFGKPYYLICELGIDGQSTLLRMIIDGKEIKYMQLPFKIDLGGIDVPGGVIGADLNGDNGASFEMGTMMIFRTTMMSSQIDVLTKMILNYYQSSKRHFLSFNGNQWMRVNKVNFQEPIQKNNKLFILNDPNMAVKFADVERRPHIDSKDSVYALFQPETIVQINRVIANGGTIVDEQWMDTVIRTLKAQGIYSIQ
ncbi:MAG: hypothetical protein AB1401_14620 [Thermodesulfobacteriota bacterium]